MKFSYSAIWDDAVGLLRANATLLLAVAGVFLFLPALVVAYLLPMAEVEPSRMVAAIQAYYAANWHWLLLANLINMVGAVAMLHMLLGPDGRTVGGSIAASFGLLPTYIGASLLSGLAMGLAIIVLLVPLIVLLGATAVTTGPASALIILVAIVPAAYIFGRLLVVGPAIVAERELNPVRALARSAALTRKRGWAVLGLVLLVFLAGAVVTMALSYVVGAIFLLLAGQKVGGLLVLLLKALLGAIVSTILTAMIAAIYRRLTTAAPTSGA